jgi:DNA-binding winged helix-turn-helix (wHTH) protein
MRSEPPNGAPDSSSPTRSRVGNWVIDPALDEISSQGKVVKLEPRTMRLLVYLVEHRERVVGVQELLDSVWANVIVTSQSVYSTIAQLRQALGDMADSPAYIATVPRKGYRLIAPVSEIPAAERGPASAGAGVAAAAPATAGATLPTHDQGDIAALEISSGTQTATTPGLPPVPQRRWWSLSAVAVALGILIFIYRYEHGQWPARVPPAPVPGSIAVLPFLDLSEKQDAPYLADGLTEELIDILAHNTALRVPARTSSFYFKGRTETVADIARQLNVANLLEGSVPILGTQTTSSQSRMGSRRQSPRPCRQSSRPPSARLRSSAMARCTVWHWSASSIASATPVPTPTKRSTASAG